MLYIRKLFTQDLRDGKQIAFPKEPSYSFFDFDYLGGEVDRNITFVFNAKFEQFQEFDGKTISTRLYAAGSESRMDGEVKAFIRDELNAEVDDLLIFKTKGTKHTDFEVMFVPKGNKFYPLILTLCGGENHSVYSYSSNQPDVIPSEMRTRQQIYYGAPGTGKSFEINRLTKDKEVIRTTFHPDSDYSTFVGAYKPTSIEIPVRDVTGKIIVENGKQVTENRIVYEFVEQAFLQAYSNAWKAYAETPDGEKAKEQYLVIEEINRGNCAQIFGDLFQLLDRNCYGFSDYPITADKDMKKQLAKAFKDLSIADADRINGIYDKDIVSKVLNGDVLLLPDNLYIWATMNTSDQSLFPIDSAFKRRWDWKYIKITEGKDKDTKQPLGWKILVDDIQDDKVRIYDWWEFLRRMNDVIYGATESADKQMGYFFAKAIDKFKGTKVGEINKAREYIEKEPEDLQADYITADTFVNKVMFYLWTDVMKDNEYSEIIELMKKDGEQLKFTDFFDESGDEVNHEALRSFLDNVMKDEDKICDVCNTELVQSLGDGIRTGFKPHSVIFKINEMVDDPYERVKGMWRMSEARANKDITKYVYGYATPEKKIVSCYEVTEWKKVTDEKGKPRFSFDGNPIKDDPMIGQPVEQIAHARGGVVFYTDNWEKK